MSEELQSDNVQQATPAQPATARQTFVETPQEANSTQNVKTQSDNNSFVVPDDYKDSGWAKNIKSNDDLWKAHANAQSLIGKKTIGIPDENSTPEQLQEYYSKVRPKEASEYEFAEGTTEEEKAFYSKLMHDNGLTKAQAKALSEAVHNQAAEAFSKDGMIKELKTSFGDDYEVTAKEASILMSSNMSADDKALLESMPNNLLAVFYRFANNVKNNYGAKESMAASANSGSMPMDKNSMQARADNLYNQITELSKRPHSSTEKSKLVKEYSDIIVKLKG